MLLSQVHERECGLFWVDICDVANERVASWLGDGNGVPCVNGGHADGICCGSVCEMEQVVGVPRALKMSRVFEVCNGRRVKAVFVCSQPICRSTGLTTKLLSSKLLLEKGETCGGGWQTDDDAVDDDCMQMAGLETFCTDLPCYSAGRRIII